MKYQSLISLGTLINRVSKLSGKDYIKVSFSNGYSSTQYCSNDLKYLLDATVKEIDYSNKVLKLDINTVCFKYNKVIKTYICYNTITATI